MAKVNTSFLYHRLADRLMQFIACVFLSLLLVGCASEEGDTTTLDQLQGLGQGSNVAGSTGLNSIRAAALQETALSVGAQGGLSERSKQINTTLAANSASLDNIFNFNLMMLDHNVLPPVLVQGEASLALDDDNTIRIADRTYQIISQARFVTTPPNWRDYLWLNYSKPALPDNSLLPKNSNERDIWKKYAALGWQNGATQANTIYITNLARLKRDFMGMVRYRVLLSQHMVSAPFVATTDLGVTGDNSNLRINDQVLRITALPSLQTNSKLWRPVINQ